MVKILILAFFLALQTLNAQTFIGDTSVVYTHQEAIKIALKLTQGQECDTLLKIANEEIRNDSIIQRADRLNIRSLTSAIQSQDTIIKHKDETINIMGKKLTNTKTGSWLLIAGIILLILKQ